MAKMEMDYDLESKQCSCCKLAPFSIMYVQQVRKTDFCFEITPANISYQQMMWV